MRKPLLIGIVLLTPFALGAAANNLSELAKSIITLINYASGVVIAASIAIYFWAIAWDFKNVMQGGEMKRKEELLFWGIIGVFVMVSIWGILRVISNSIFSL